MQKKGANISLKGYDDIFSTDQSRAEAKQERVQEIPLSELHPFEGHVKCVIIAHFAIYISNSRIATEEDTILYKSCIFIYFAINQAIAFPRCLEYGKPQVVHFGMVNTIS